MTDTTTFHVSQGLDILTPRSGEAYPIGCDEWDVLKGRLKTLSSEPWFFHTVGSVLVGAGLSTFVAILLGTFSAAAQQDARVVAWSVVAVTLISGALCLFFAEKERAVQRIRASDIVTQMDLIEKRFERRAV
jgi:Na+/melibiose symporter-like transporter